MRPNFEVRPGAVAHLALAQGHPCLQASMFALRTYSNSNPFMQAILETLHVRLSGGEISITVC